MKDPILKTLPTTRDLLQRITQQDELLARCYDAFGEIMQEDCGCSECLLAEKMMNILREDK